MTPNHRIEDSADVSVVRFYRDKAKNLIGKGAEVKAWAMIDDAGQFDGTLLQAACDLCPCRIQSTTPEELAAHWRLHYDGHDVDGKHG